jgi:hypothetical protein
LEPYRLRRWKAEFQSGREAVFWTCARPGRSRGSKGAVSDHIVDMWAHGLPGGVSAAVISLLGRKKSNTGTSEFSFYSFSGGLDTPEERKGRPTFQGWLDKHHSSRHIQVIEHPTIDFQPSDLEILEAVAATLEELTGSGRTVTIMDSGGETRTGAVCRFMGAKEQPGALAAFWGPASRRRTTR